MVRSESGGSFGWIVACMLERGRPAGNSSVSAENNLCARDKGYLLIAAWECVNQGAQKQNANKVQRQGFCGAYRRVHTTLNVEILS
jgi:hypothetical protein